MSVIPFLTASVNGNRTQEQLSLEFGVWPGRNLEASEAGAPLTDGDCWRNPDIWLYRDRTTALLRRYFRISIEVGRLPSLVGREVFRSRVTAYRMRTFEDAVIFVHDVEKALEQLNPLERELVAKIVFQEYTQDEAARIMGCWRRTVGRRYTETLDRLSEIFLEGGLLSQLPLTKKPPQSCQEGENGEKSVSASMYGK